MGREIFRFAQHPPHTRFDTMGGFFDQYKELQGTLSPCDMETERKLFSPLS